MSTDFRALCAELLAWADKTSAHYYAPPEVLVRARTALAEPEPEGPTRRQLMMLADGMGMASVGDAAEYARAVLARWATPNSAEIRRSSGEPADGEVAELATAEMMRQLRTKAATEKANRCHYSSKLFTRAADLLERLSLPHPVPGEVEG